MTKCDPVDRAGALYLCSSDVVTTEHGLTDSLVLCSQLRVVHAMA